MLATAQNHIINQYVKQMMYKHRTQTTKKRRKVNSNRKTKHAVFTRVFTIIQYKYSMNASSICSWMKFFFTLFAIEKRFMSEQ